MIAVAAGMESDGSGSDCEIVYANLDGKEAPKKHVDKEMPGAAKLPNGVVKTAVPEENVDTNSTNKLPRNRIQCQPKRRRLVFNQRASRLLDDLRFAVMQGNLQVTKDILDGGIYVDGILKAGWTPLMYACSSGRPEIVAYLLENNADPNFHKDMFTPLMAVCASAKKEDDLVVCCQYLLQHGANVNAHERHFTTPLMFAAREGHFEIIKELVDHEANLEEQDNKGRTALAWAASHGYGQIVRFLVEKGADTKKVDFQGQSPIDLAYERGHKEVVSLLEKSALLIRQASEGESADVESSRSVKERRQMMAVVKPVESQFTRHGDLEILLSAAGYSDLIPKFYEQQLTFKDVLIMTDEDLEKVGIPQIGIRKKILEAVKKIHKTDWETSSLPNLRQYQYISCPDAVAMMANISKHLKYISSSIIYIRQQIQSQPRILEIAQDSGNVHDLIDEIEDSLKNVTFLNDEIRFLKQHLNKVQDNVQYIPADLIVETVASNSKGRTLHIVIGITIASLAIGSVLWKHPNILGNILSITNVKIPFLT